MGDYFIDAVTGREDSEDDPLACAGRRMRYSRDWYDVERYAGDTERFSVHFLNPLGPQVVACGGGKRPWASVSGEFHAR